MTEQKKLAMRDPKSGRVYPDQDSIDKYLEVARGEKKKQLFFYRKRTGYNSYLIQLYEKHPSNEKQTAEVVFEISGATRQEILKMKDFPNGKPVKPVIKEGKPVKGSDLKPINDPRPTQPEK